MAIVAVVPGREVPPGFDTENCNGFGVLFVGGPRLAQACLAGCMSRSWTGTVPRSRLEI